MGDFEDEEQEQITLNSDKITDIIAGCMTSKLNTEKWNPKKVDGWTKDIIDTCLKQLGEMKKPFKFVVTCIIMQKVGAGLQSAFCARWDKMKDGVFSAPFDNDYLYCITTVYGLKTD